MNVLIIGAGAAGITAGHLLAERGIEFEILEASSTHGGRVRKLEGFADFPIDLGGEWIHTWIGAKPAAFTSLLDGDDSRFPTVVDKPDSVSIWNDRTLRKANWIRHLPAPKDLKFANATWFDAIETLATTAVLGRTHFNTPVTGIDYRSGGVQVTTADGAVHEADKVLITVPISMLQRETIEFTPALPADKTAEINKEAMPGGLKVFIEFAERFYPDVVHVDGFLSNIGIDNAVYYNAAFGKQSSQHVLGLFAQGSKAERYLAHTTDDAVFDYVLAELDEIFDGQASEHYIKHVVQDWTREPFIMGSYSQRKASAKKLSEPVASRLYFAGEAMNPNGKTIAIHGACESAYSAINAMVN